MPGRQSHGPPVNTKKEKRRSAPRKRALDAFAIASHQAPDRLKVRQHRLGVQEGGKGLNKRQRIEEEDGGESEQESQLKKRKKRLIKGRFDELDTVEGSDSEGNEWKLGQVDSDDDSDLDSDEAFGESDEERFEGFSFSGSANRTSKSKVRGRKDVNLDEDEKEESNAELEDGDLGEGAGDLAELLEISDSDEEIGDNPRMTSGNDSEEDESASLQSEIDSVSSVDEDEDDETSDPAKIAALQNVIANLSQEDSSRSQLQKRESANESATPSGFGIRSMTKLTLEDLGLPTVHDPQIQRSLKYLKAEDTGKKIPGKLEVPLAKRQQDRVDRSAAYDKTKETLDRWTDTVKHNRRAEHLEFPLVDNGLATAHSNKELAPTLPSRPFNDLEATIQSILEESGLATVNGKDDEDRIREFEELETNKLTVEDVKARTEQLRMARELLFREEAKAKRIKKIKSKSYRKVHRKQREKEARVNQEALAEGGYVASEDELEAQDRRRAEGRMSAKHRSSKWAKSLKATGRAAWDEDARSAVTERAKRDEELRRRVEGKAIRKEYDSDSESSFQVSEDDAEEHRALKGAQVAAEIPLVDASVPGARLANMDFMRKADTRRRKQNQDSIQQIRRELAGEDSPSEEGDEDVGRRSFGPGITAKQHSKPSASDTREFEEAVDFDGEDNDNEFEGFDDLPRRTETGRTRQNGRGPEPLQAKTVQARQSPISEGGAWSKVNRKPVTINEAEFNRRRHKKDATVFIEELDLAQAAHIAARPVSSKVKKESNALRVEGESDYEDDTNVVQLPFAIRDQKLIKRAFAGADVFDEFELEKKQIMEDEEDKIIDETLPGWGCWVGDGLSKKEKARNFGKVLKKVEGIKADKRKDAKLERVIINEKRIKKNGKYLAPSLPHPFETRQQYERSLRLPIGPEWATKETFQEATKPRVLLKQGIITPMSKPLL